MVILIWVGSAELIQIIFTSASTDFNNPLFLTYFSTSFFTIYLIPLLYTYIKLFCCGTPNPSTLEAQATFRRDLKQVLRIAGVSALFWFSLNYFYNLGLLYATLTSSVIISNTSAAWVFVVSVSCLMPTEHKQRFCAKKAVFVAISVAGFVVITRQDSKEQTNWLGDFFTLLSAVIYACYANYLKVKVPEETEKNFHFSWFFGFIGAINDVIILPLFPLFDWLGIEQFEWPNG
jgi:solute carrier family 35 protein F5